LYVLDSGQKGDEIRPLKGINDILTRCLAIDKFAKKMVSPRTGASMQDIVEPRDGIVMILNCEVLLLRDDRPK
jgi:hypothetical protein